MVTVLTSEAQGRVIQTAEAADFKFPMDFAIPTGDAIVVNGLSILVMPGSPDTAAGQSAGTILVSLTTDGAVANIPSFGGVDEFDANAMGGTGGLAYMDYSFLWMFPEATETGGLALNSNVGIWDWRSLPVNDRPLTTEIMEFAATLEIAALNMDFTMTIAYQRVHLTQADLGPLQPGNRIIRFPNIPEAGWTARIGRVQ